MSERKAPAPPGTPTKPPKGGSGEHPAVEAMREKFDSIAEHTEPELDAVIERIKRLAKKSDRPVAPKDPRREDEDEVPIDVVELDESFPTSGTIKKKET